MNKFKIFVLLIVIFTLLTGCAAPHLSEEFRIADGSIQMPEITPAPTPVPVEQESFLPEAQTVGEVVYDPLRVPSAFADSEDFSQELYGMLAAAIREGAESVDFGSLEVTEAQFNAVRKYLITRNPWGTLSDITKGEGTQIVIAYAQEDVQERIDFAKRFDDAAALMLKNVVKPESTQLSAALALYKHIAQTVVMDYEAADYGLYSAVVQGEGTDLTFAHTYGFMLDQIGVKNVVVSSEDGSHAWNVLTIGGQSFHCDVQMEAGLNGGRALSGFGLSDADAAHINGWNTWISENAELLTCSQSLMAEVNDAQYADVDVYGNAVYFDSMDGVKGVWRKDLATGAVLQIAQTEPDALAVLGEHVFYVDSADGMMYSYRIADGDVRQALEGVPIASMRRVGSEVRYVSADDPEETENAISIE